MRDLLMRDMRDLLLRDLLLWDVNSRDEKGFCFLTDTGNNSFRIQLSH
jgi:hypothetical protein